MRTFSPAKNVGLSMERTTRALPAGGGVTECWAATCPPEAAKHTATSPARKPAGGAMRLRLSMNLDPWSGMVGRCVSSYRA